MDFYKEEDLQSIIINILLNDLQNREEFESIMMVLEDSIDILREIFEKEPEKVMILCNEILRPIL